MRRIIVVCIYPALRAGLFRFFPFREILPRFYLPEKSCRIFANSPSRLFLRKPLLTFKEGLGWMNKSYQRTGCCGARNDRDFKTQHSCATSVVCSCLKIFIEYEKLRSKDRCYIGGCPPLAGVRGWSFWVWKLPLSYSPPLLH